MAGGDLTDGVWAGTAGSDEFNWEIRGDGQELSGLMHWVSDGKKETELPVYRSPGVSPLLELHMDATGVTYRGTVDLAAGWIAGQLFYGEDPGPGAG